MKKTLILTFAAGLAMSASATYTTPNQGESYTFTKLASIENSGVTLENGAFVISDNIVISDKDSFVIESGITVKMKSGFDIQIYGAADFKAADDKRVLITRYDADATPKGIYMRSEIKTTEFKNIDFEYAQLREFATGGMTIENCTFKYGNNKLNSSGAISFGKSSQITVKNCTFESNVGPAIGGAANTASGQLIENCTFIDNNTGNSNKCQLNLVVGGDKDVIVRNCTVKGTQRPRVGAVCVTNLGSLPGKNNALIEGCDISDSRYGIYLVGSVMVNAIVRNNKIHGCAVNGGYGLTFSSGSTSVVYGNLIYDNLVGAEFDGTAVVSLGQVDSPDSPGNNEFANNKTEGTEIDLQNFTMNTIYAQNNLWGVEKQTEEEISKVIQTTNGDKTFGQVIFMPAKGTSAIDEMTTGKNEKLVVEGSVLYAPIESGEAAVYGIDGRLIKIIPISDNKASLDLPDGIYIVRVGNEYVKFIL